MSIPTAHTPLSACTLQALISQLPDRVVIKDHTSTFIACNQRFADDLGLAVDAISGKTDFDFFPPQLAARYQADDQRVIRNGESITVQEPGMFAGNPGWLETSKSPIFDAAGQCIGLTVIIRDISQRLRDIDEMRRQSWAVQANSRTNQALVQARDENELLQAVCEAIVADQRYQLALICGICDVQQKQLQVLACAGSARGYAEQLQVSWDEHEATGQGPIGHCIRQGSTVSLGELQQQPQFQPWQAGVRQFGLQAIVAIPLVAGPDLIGALAVYAGEAQSFGPVEVQVFEELTRNVQFGIQSRRTQVAYQQSLQEQASQAQVLEKALENALAAIASVLEQRDPYTAGHQKHVAELAVLIGQEMGLSDERLRGLYLSGVVHDLGKIEVPAEILSKPSRLHPVEFALVKRHPDVAYNILKNIDFPWPIADIIRQHHEFMDGSGYPLGLRGDAILLEARILTVADIVESMSSDRPYRAALGIEQAIAQIRLMRGVQLDPEAVDACIRVLELGAFTPHLLSLQSDD